MASEQIKIINIWADETGESHIRDIEVDLHEISQGGALSEPIAINHLWFRTTPQNQDTLGRRFNFTLLENWQ